MHRILGIAASPRKSGGSIALLKCALLAAEEEGIKTEIVYLYDHRIEPCIGCIKNGDERDCKYPCIFDDYGKEILKKLKEFDGYIIATPVYWYGPSGPLKILIDRMTALENMVVFGEQSYVEGKVVGVITVGSDAGVTLCGAYLITVLNAMGAIIPPWAHAYSHRGKDAIYDDRAVMDAINVGRLSAKLIKVLEGKREELLYKEDFEQMKRIRERVLKQMEGENDTEIYKRKDGKTLDR